jgi:K+-sensing histidine kinase KdpD
LVALRRFPWLTLTSRNAASKDITSESQNLLLIAVEFTDPGGAIGLTVEHEVAQAVLRVRDNGSGMKAELVVRVFDLFPQGDRSQGGLGIGVTLVNQLVEMHGGTVEARKAVGSPYGEEAASRPCVRAFPIVPYRWTGRWL